MSLVRWNPTHSLWGFEDDMNRMMDRFFSPDLFNGSSGWMPSMDVTENKDEYRIQVELPGLKKDDVNFTLKEDMLTIEGERKQEQEKNDVNIHRVERRYGKFRRSINLPKTVKADKIDASFKDGILTVHLPKAEEVKPKEIKVKVEA